ncbi:MAG: hypothetical protein AB7J13_00840 [Pyrinomonadaceae bacterium]
MTTVRSLILFTILGAAVLAAYPQGNIGDGGKATDAVLESPSGIAIDADGNVYIAERRANRIRRVDAKTGTVTTFAGTGKRGFSGDGGKAAAADISIPELIAFDNKGNLLITDRGNGRIRRIDAKTAIISTIVGTGVTGFSGDGGKAADAKISSPFGVGVDKDDNIYFADTENHAIRRIDAKTGTISSVAGTGKEGFAGDGGPAVNALLRRPHNFAIDENGDLFIGDSFNLRIRRVTAKTGKIETLYGIGEVGFSDDGVAAANAKFGYFGSILVTKDHLIVSDWINKRIRRIDRKTGIMTSFNSAEGKPIEIDGPYGMAVDSQNNLYVAAANENRVMKIDMTRGTVTKLAGQ